MFKNIFPKSILCAAVLVAAYSSTYAQVVGTAGQPSAAAISAKLKELYPTRQFGPVSASPIPGLYEVITGETISYIDASGRYLLYSGQLMDYKDNVNITEKRLGEVNKIDAASLPLNDAIKMVKGNGKRTLIVFADPNCGFCKKLENDIQAMTDVTVYTFLIPILQDSKPKAVSIWCSSDRLKAWDDLMIRSVQPLPGGCENPVDRNLAVAQKMRVNSTPTMFSMDGRRLAGAVGLQSISDFLDTKAVAEK